MAEQPILRAQGINKQFGAVMAASDINVDVPHGSVLSLIGSNGAGKTTFVNMVTGYIKPDTGTFSYQGQDITGSSPRHIARMGIHRSFQIPQLCGELTVLENLLVAESINADTRPSFFRSALDAETVEQTEAILDRFGILPFAHQPISELPGGIKKLLDIAMAMAGSTRIMLLDEPTSGVAADEKFPIMDRVIEALSTQGVTILFVEHDMEIVSRYSDRVLAFYAGRIIADDAPATVMADADVQRYITGSA